MSHSKESPDVVDLTTLQKRVIIKKEKPIEKTHNLQADSSGYVSLFPATQQTSSENQTQETNSNPFAFLDSIANANSPPTFQQTPQENQTDFTDLKIKLEDFEYKLERLMEKIAIIESKLQELGK